jgi:hypothetical protein
MRAQPLLPSADDADRQIPGFGGYFLDEDGVPTLYIAAGADRDAAEAAFGDYFAELGVPGSEMNVVPGRYAWSALERWKGVATASALAVEGAVFVDNDETKNRVHVGIESAAAEGEVRAALARAGVPPEAVVIDEVEPFHQVATLRNIVDRPVRAGVQINFSGFLCSVGFNATSSSGQRSFVTASHCTARQGGVESTAYFQPLQSTAPGQIATEVSDPVYVSGGSCPSGRVCRRSDAARAAYLNGANQALGLIARTSGPNSTSLDVVGSLTVVSDDTNNGAAVNSTVHKVGRTTGWSAGPLRQKCINVNVSGSNITQLCQNTVSARVGGGDSGSDAFQVISGTSVRLEGVLWGGSSDGSLFVYSPLANVLAELGSLTTH